MSIGRKGRGNSRGGEGGGECQKGEREGVTAGVVKEEENVNREKGKG